MKHILTFFVLLSALAITLRSAEKSPDGSFVLVTSIEESKIDPTLYGCVILEIKDSQNHVIHQENTRASSFQRWNIRWLSNDKIELQSSDIGKLIWIRTQDGKWQKQESQKE